MNKNSIGSAQDLRRFQLHERAFDCRDAGDFQGFAKCVHELLRHDPHEPWVDHIYGFLQSESGNQKEAIPLLRRATGLLPDYIEPKITLGIALMKNSECDEAEELFERTLAMYPNSFLATTNLACVLLTRVEEPCPERAEKLLRQADQLEPDDDSVWANLGHALAQQERWTEAYPALKKAIQLDRHGESCRRIAIHYPELAGMANRKLAEVELNSERDYLNWLIKTAIAGGRNGPRD